MLPLKAIQLSYQDIGNLVWKHKERIESFCSTKEIKFDLIVAKLRNGIHAGSIISTYLHLPLGVMEVNPVDGTSTMLWPVDINREDPLNILVVDTVSNTGTSLNDMVQGVLREQPTARVYSYATLLAAENTFKPDIPGEIVSDFIQAPWEWLSFTPFSHLERLENNNDHIFSGKEYFVAFSSQECLELLEIQLVKKIKSEQVKVYQNFAANKNISRSNSGFSSLNVQDYRGKGIDVYYGPVKRVITDKIEFIKKNGVSHFIEENLEEAVLLASHCPVTHILYIEKEHLLKIHSHNYDPKTLRL